MLTACLSLDDPDWKTRATALLEAGELVAVPTETVYGLAGDATNPQAVAAIFTAKGRPAHNPLIVHVADLAMAQRHAVLDARAVMLAEHFWPGPLTLVAPLRPDAGLAQAVAAGGDSLALRCPDGALRALARHLDRPLAAPSANRSGHVTATSADHVLADLEGRIAMVLDGGPTRVGVESTILDVRGETPVILRPGGVSAEALAGVLSGAVATNDRAQAAPSAPGLLASHYAPTKPVLLNVLPGEVPVGFLYLGFGDHALEGSPTLSATGSLDEAAAGLFAALRDLDGHQGAGIAIAPIPERGLGAAINNRLKRAAAPREG